MPLADLRGSYLEACRETQHGLNNLERLLRVDISQAPPLDTKVNDARTIAKMTQQFDAYLESLWQATKTLNNIHRDKMFYHIFDEFGLGVLALLNMEIELPN